MGIASSNSPRRQVCCGGSDPARCETKESRAARIAGALLFVLAACVVMLSAMSLLTYNEPRASVTGIVILLSAATVIALLKLIGGACLVVVVIDHLCEALGWLPLMQWGVENSIGHYIDLVAAIGGLSLFPIGYLLGAVTREAA